jgi:hypothetical protein
VKEHGMNISSRVSAGVFLFFGMLANASALARMPAGCDYESAQWPRCVITHAGAESGAALAAQGGEFLQALIMHDDYGVLLQFTRLPNGSIAMALRDASFRRPVYVLTVSDVQWREITARWRSLPVDAAKARADMKEQDAADSRNGREKVCIHPWDAYYESNLTGAPMTDAGNSCADPGEMQFADFLTGIAFSRALPCGLLDDNYFDRNPLTLEQCLKLQGDKLAAAHVLNATTALAQFDFKNGPHTVADYAAAIAPDGWLRLAGHAKVLGGTAVANAWVTELAKLPGGDIEPEVVTGSDDGAIVEGSISAFYQGKRYAYYKTARYRQTWRRQADGAFKVTAWEIGTFRLDRSR